MNNIQRAGVFATIAMIVAVVVIHGPWDGYSTTIFVEGIRGGFPDSRIDREFLDWRSNAPLIDWFATISHVFVALFAIGALSLAWHFLFRTR